MFSKRRKERLNHIFSAEYTTGAALPGKRRQPHLPELPNTVLRRGGFTRFRNVKKRASQDGAGGRVLLPYRRNSGNCQSKAGNTDQVPADRCRWLASERLCSPFPIIRETRNWRIPHKAVQDHSPVFSVNQPVFAIVFCGNKGAPRVFAAFPWPKPVLFQETSCHICLSWLHFLHEKGF